MSTLNDKIYLRLINNTLWHIDPHPSNLDLISENKFQELMDFMEKFCSWGTLIIHGGDLNFFGLVGTGLDMPEGGGNLFLG